MPDYNKNRTCDVCGKGFTRKEWEDSHNFHEPDCMRTTDPLKASFFGFECDCDLLAHANCCPDCNPSTEWANRNGYPKKPTESN